MMKILFMELNIMKIYNYNSEKRIKNKNNSGVKTKAEFTYYKKDKDGKIKTSKFVSKFVSTIDIPYGKYILK